MLQNGTLPWVAMPALKVTACCSAMPTSNARSGISASMYFNEQPDGIAGVTPTTRASCFANSMMLCPNTS